MVCGVIRCVSEWVCIWCVWQALGSRAGAMCKTQHKTHLALPLKHMILPQAPSPLHHSPLPSSPPLPPPPHGCRSTSPTCTLLTAVVLVNVATGSQFDWREDTLRDRRRPTLRGT